MVDYNTKGRQIHKGPRGGEYVLVGGRKVYKFERAPAGSGAGPSARRASPPRAASPRTPPKAGFTKTPYTNVQTGLSVYKKDATGRYYVRLRVPEHGRTDGTITLDHKVRNASGTIKKLREWLSGSTSTSGASGTYTQMPYKTNTGKQIFKKARSYFYRNTNGVYHPFSTRANVTNNRGVRQPLRDHLKGKKPKTPPRRAPSPPRSQRISHEKWTRMGYAKSVYELTADGQRIYKKNTKYWYSTDDGWVAEVMPRMLVKDTRTGETGFFSVIKAKSNARKAGGAGPAPRAKPAPTPRRAPSPPRGNTVEHFEGVYKRNLTRSDLAKVRRYAKEWLGKNIPANASYKRIALVIHPNKGNRTNAVNQAKRTALFKYLSQIK